MKKVIVISFAILFLIGAGMAYAVPKVGVFGQMGSVLVFPKIDTLTAPGNETYILIANNNNQPVQVHCQWVVVGAPLVPSPGCLVDPGWINLLPPTQTPSDMLFTLTPFQPIMIQASTGTVSGGDLVGVNGFGSNNLGYLACWAVDSVNGATQVSFNHLSGMAYVLNAANGYSYPAWSFQAQVPFRAAVGTAGELKFNITEYDAMPGYLTFNVPTVGAAADAQGLQFTDLELTVIPGKQNFTNMRFVHNAVQARFDAWDENENRYSGGAQCMWCWFDGFLGNIRDGGTGMFLFRSATMHSSVARFRLSGAASFACVPDLTLEQAEACFGQRQEFNTFASPLLGIGVQQISAVGVPSPPLYVTSNLPIGVGQDTSASFVWRPY